MIVPKKKEDPYKRYYSAAITALVCILVYISLYIARVTDPDSTQIQMSEMTELNITQFEPEVEEPDLEAEDEIEEEEPAEQEEAPEEAEAETPAPERVDMEDMLPEGVEVDLSISEAEQQTTPDDTEADTDVADDSDPSSLRMDETEIERSGISSLEGDELTSPTEQRESPDGDLGDDGSGLGVDEGGGLSDEDRGITNGADGGSLLDGAQVREGQDEGQEVGVQDLEDFGDDYSDVDPIIHDLIEWMKENPADLPSPVRRVMEDGRWDDSYLTSRVPFHTDDEQFDLFLMVKEDILEVHIFLVENHQDATYLIDRGFQQQSSYLRVGNVGYDEEDLAEIDSRMRQARTDDTQEFYQVFLSWWNSVEE